jgi:hypothetical protein
MTKHRAWKVEQTGGGCTALRMDSVSGGWYWITDDSISAPRNPNSPCVVGYYTSEDGEQTDGTPVAWHEAANLAEAKAWANLFEDANNA